MPPVTVLILAPAADPAATPLVRLLDDARTTLAERHRRAFLAAGVDEVVVRREPADATPFGARLRRLVAELRAGRPRRPGCRVHARSRPARTSGPSSRPPAATRPRPSRTTATRRTSWRSPARPVSSRALPDDLASDNALPRWLAEVAGVEVRDLRARRRLAMDVDSPLDLLLLEGFAAGQPRLPGPSDADAEPVRRRLAELRRAGRRPRRRAAGRGADVRRPTCGGSRPTRDRGRGRSSRSAG